MSNDVDAKIIQIFCSEVGIEESAADDAIAYDSMDSWDSLKHLVIVSRLEEAFNLEFDVDDIIDMNTLGKIREIVKRYVNQKEQ